MIMIGFHGDTAEDPRFKDVVRQLESGVVSGVLFLGYNIKSRKELMRMTALLRGCRCREPPFIAVDEEGGRIQRLNSSAGFSDEPSAKRVGQSRNEEGARRVYGDIAEKVANAGFNLNFGPVLDVDLNPDNPIIGALGRSFSADPTSVTRFARIFVASHRRMGVLTSLKHFPGHGSARGDTHVGIVDVTGTWNGKIELMPYRKLIAEGLADSVMVGHISSNAWNGLATQSPADAISGLLRTELGYRGVVITDDLEMGAVRANNPDFSQAILRAVEAGNDILLVSNRELNRPKLGDWMHSLILEAVRGGRIPRERIASSLDRIRALKAKLSSSK